MGPRESYFGTGAGLHETVTWRGGGEVANEVASGGGDGSGSFPIWCYNPHFAHVIRSVDLYGTVRIFTFSTEKCVLFLSSTESHNDRAFTVSSFPKR
ncbi:hypothetical protein E2C01_048674 [Portunus trituberculatus]|uniref:Uncharacterized protein n=1 Tax=Portunus trituberculatus TaxID=210409 RepID=A0A5B7GC92_PORTR|nr:hypothetical protein [Portunus trituberculatus]